MHVDATGLGHKRRARGALGPRLGSHDAQHGCARLLAEQLPASGRSLVAAAEGRVLEPKRLAVGKRLLEALAVGLEHALEARRRTLGELRNLGELRLGKRLEAERAVVAAHPHPVGRQHVPVGSEAQSRVEALHEGDGTGVRLAD